MNAHDVQATLWLATVTFTAALLLVALLRKPLRRLLGAERAYVLWAAPLMACVMALLPHSSATPVSIVEVLQRTAGLAQVRTLANTPAPIVVNWADLVADIWLAGAATLLLQALIAQVLLRRRMRTWRVLADPTFTSSLPVLQANDARVGPALIGLHRPCIVVPADFAERYGAEEQRLMLLHEATHATRRDVHAHVVAVVLRALAWFHPLAWWALPAFRRDQELACDAAVLRTYRPRRRDYAEIMLKAQYRTRVVAAGCMWMSGHPLKERIAMLKLDTPSRSRRVSGAILVAIILTSLCGAVYAATQKTADFQPSKALLERVFTAATGAKTAVASYLYAHAGRAPSGNAQAGLLQPDGFRKVDAVLGRVEVVDGGAIMVQMRDTRQQRAGTLLLIPMWKPSSNALPWACVSPDIKDIRALAPSCTYAPNALADLRAVTTARRFTLELKVSVNGAPPRLHATICLKPGEYYHLTEADVGALQPWEARFSVFPTTGGFLDIRGELRGGTLGAGVQHPNLLTWPGQQATIQVGRRVERTDGTSAENQTLRVDAIARPGCRA